MSPRLSWPWRAGVSLLCFALLRPMAQEQFGRWVMLQLLELGQWLGAEVFRSGPDIMHDMSLGGPFLNWPRWANMLYGYACEWLPDAAAFSFGILVYHSLTLWPRRRPNGDTRCGGCGYVLKGLSAPRCPECGRAI